MHLSIKKQNMKKSEIENEAKKLIERFFKTLLKSTDKDRWQNALVFIADRLRKLEIWPRWNEMFIWREIRKIMNNKYWKKFIIKT